MYIGLWGLEEPLVSGLDRRSVLVFVALLRCGRLPFASQLGWLGPLPHTALTLVKHCSGASHELRSCLLPLVLLGKSFP